MNKLIPSLMLICASVGLSGCGGGGGGASSTPITSSSAVISSSSLSSSSVVAMSQLTIKGTVAAADLAGGEVIFTIGAKNYKTAIDSSSKYSIALEVPVTDTDKPFTAIATGASSKSWVQFAALYPSLASLTEKAGNDKVLSVDEFFGVNITPLTTAQYAEVKNDNASLTNDLQLRNALLDLHPIRPLEGAGLLLRLLAADDFELPEQAKTTLDFLLDASLYEAYVGIAGIKDPDWIDEYLDTLQNDSAQTFVSTTKLAGNYFIETKNLSSYLVSLHENGTGQLTTGNLDKQYDNYPVTVNFTWKQTDRLVSLEFDEPVKNTVNEGRFSDPFYNCDDSLTMSVRERCNLSYKAIELELISEAAVNEFAKVRLIGIAKNSNDETVLDGVFNEQLAHLTAFNKVASVSASDLIGHEWFTPEYSYKFMTNNVVQVTTLRTNTTVERNWAFESPHIQIDDVGLWLINTNPAGYDIVEANSLQVFKTSLFKRSAVTMTEADWVGRWTGFPRDINSNAQDVNADKTWGDGFEASVAGNWKLLDGHRQSALANGVWRMIRDVLAIHDGKYYMSICQGVDNTPFTPGCYLSVATRAENFDSNVFWGSWSYPAFNEKKSGDILVPIGNVAFAEENGAGLYVSTSSRVAANKLFNRNENTIIELISANKNEIELCEYAVFKACSDANKRVYAKGIQVKITAGAIARLDYWGHDDMGTLYTLNPTFSKVFMLPGGKGTNLEIYSSQSDRSIQSVIGCDATRQFGNNYWIPPRNSDCEIVVTFSSSP